MNARRVKFFVIISLLKRSLGDSLHFPLNLLSVKCGPASAAEAESGELTETGLRTPRKRPRPQGKGALSEAQQVRSCQCVGASARLATRKQCASSQKVPS